MLAVIVTGIPLIYGAAVDEIGPMYAPPWMRGGDDEQPQFWWGRLDVNRQPSRHITVDQPFSVAARLRPDSEGHSHHIIGSLNATRPAAAGVPVHCHGRVGVPRLRRAADGASGLSLSPPEENVVEKHPLGHHGRLE